MKLKKYLFIFIVLSFSCNNCPNGIVSETIDLNPENSLINETIDDLKSVLQKKGILLDSNFDSLTIIEKLNSITNEINKGHSSNYNYKPFIFPQKKTIKLGEEYQAIITLSTDIDEFNKDAKILLGEFIKGVFKPKHDTITYTQGAIYSLTPKQKGTYNWGGIIFLNENYIKRHYSFSETFEVK